jgi:Cysteine-rich CWC
MRGPVSKVCECCKEPFECGQYGCWCANMGVTEPQMAWIEQTFHDCLCPRCLQRVVAGEQGPLFVAKPK